jgi:hypothetical protein
MMRRTKMKRCECGQPIDEDMTTCEACGYIDCSEAGVDMDAIDYAEDMTRFTVNGEWDEEDY